MRFTESPEQIVFAEEETETAGELFKFTVTVVFPLHPLCVSVTVYVVVDDGFAITEVPVVAFSPPPGDQIKLLAPEAVSVTELPVQRVGLAGETEITGTCVTFTVTVPGLVLGHPFVPLTE